MSQVKGLIANADDFGLSSGINLGIAEAHVRSLVTNTTLMVNMPAAEEAVKLAKQLPKLGVGLHLNFTQGPPLADPATITSLLDEKGEFLLPNSHVVERWEEEHLQKELWAQVDRFLAFGLRPSHLDSHHHVHGHPKVHKLVLEAAHTLGLPVRPLKPELLDAAGIPHPDRFIGSTYFGPDRKELLLHHLQQLQPGITELMFHPGHAEEHLRPRLHWVDERKIELALLLDPEVIRSIRKLEIALVNYQVFGLCQA